MSGAGVDAAPFLPRLGAGAAGPSPLPRAALRAVGQTWRAPGAHGGRGGGGGQPPRTPPRPGSPGGLEAGLGTGFERFLGPRGRPALARAAAAGQDRAGRGAPPARLGAAGKSGPGRAAGGCRRFSARGPGARPLGAPGPFISPRWGGRPTLRRLPEKLSAPLRRREWRSTPLCPKAAGGLGSPSADWEMAPARVGGVERWGRGVGELWAYWGPPSPARTVGASGGSAGSCPGRVRAPVSGLDPSTPPSSKPLRQTRKESCAHGRHLPFIHPSPPGSPWNFQRHLLAVGPASQQELCCAGVTR